MKYFTPARYVAFNASDDGVANNADEEWEQALSDYRKHVRRIRGKLPTSVRHLGEKLCLHDAEYLGMTKISIPGSPGDVAILSVRAGHQPSLLVYVLAAEPFVSRPLEAVIFETTHPHWLYDEIDVGEDGILTHEILLSDGRVLKLRFVAFDTLSPQVALTSESKVELSATA